MNTVLLRDFAKPVSVCTVETRVEAVLQLSKKSQQEFCVLVGEAQNPLGLIRLGKLLSYIFEFTSEMIAQVSAGGETLGNSASLTLQNVQRFLPENEATLIEPLTTVLESWTVEEFWQHYPAFEAAVWVLVDASGRCTGLLDVVRLGRFCTEKGKGFPADLELTDESSSSVRGLISLLEVLPIPLMLQGDRGRVVSRNRAWREQIDVWKASSSSDEHSSTALESGSEYEQAGDRCWTDALPCSLMSPQPTHSTASQAGMNQLQNHPGNSMVQAMADSSVMEMDTCICRCSVKGGQECVWKFVKMPLQALQGLSWENRSCAQCFPTTLAESFWLVMAQDITDQQLVTRELAAKNADLVQLNRLKDEFLACISHELKTPLTAVLGLSSLLKDQLLGPLNDRQVRYAQLIYQGGRHLVLIVNDILDLTRIETGQLELTPETVAIEMVCQRAYEQAAQLRVLAETEGADFPVEPLAELYAENPFSLEIQPGLETIVADEMRLRQMLTNLLSNAIKFTEAGDKIGLNVDNWDGWIAFTVWDNGIGIPADKQHLIFQKFQQLENPLTRRFEGTGLGLVLTQRLARLHGGDVTFTSVEGKGSQFTLLLPPMPPQQWKTAREGYSPFGKMPSSKRLIMVVEAVPRYIEELTGQLKRLGYRVAIARSGTEALEKIRRLQPAAVFLNPILPLLSGWDVLTLLKTDAETQHIPVVIASTWADRGQAVSSRASGFLSVPPQLESVRQVVDELLLAPKVIEQPVTASKLTILHLRGVDAIMAGQVALEDEAIDNLNLLLHPRHCRILQVDDLDQADLLARVWKPNVLLLDGFFLDPLDYLSQLSQYATLTALPLITLTADITRAANSIPELTVFPCLEPLTTLRHRDMAKLRASALWQVIQVAASAQAVARIFVADLDILAAEPDPDLDETSQTSGVRPAVVLEAAVHNLQNAGVVAEFGRSHLDILSQIENQSIDGLILYVHRTKPTPVLLEFLQTLHRFKLPFPILVWDFQPHLAAVDESQQEFNEWLGAIATQILPPSLSPPELVDFVKAAVQKA